MDIEKTKQKIIVNWPLVHPSIHNIEYLKIYKN